MKRIEGLLLAALGLVAAALIFLAVALAVFLVRLNPTGASPQERRLALQTQVRSLESSQAEFLEWRDAGTAFGRFLHSTCYPLADFPALRREIRDLFARCELSPASAQYTTTKVGDGIVKATLEFSLDTPYPMLKKFLGEIERHPRLMFIRSAQLTSGTASPTMHGQFVLEAFLGQ